MKSFKDYLSEAVDKEVTFTFGRINPPTVGHEKLFDATAKAASGGKYFIFASPSNDAKKNPLTYEQKIKYMRKMFPRHARATVLDKKLRTIFNILVYLHDKGYTSINLVVGSDRVSEFKSLVNKYNGQKATHGLYKFKEIKITSAGERDPDSDDVSGMSASKLRAAAASNDLATFSKGMPKSFSDTQQLFNDVRTGMGLSESFSFRQHVEFAPISEEREAYVAGDLFEEKDTIVIKESGDVGEIEKLGSNYVIVRLHEGKVKRMWLTDIEKIEG